MPSWQRSSRSYPVSASSARFDASQGPRNGGATWTPEAGGGETAIDVTGPIAVRSFGILLDPARAGQGFAFLPEFMVTGPVERGELVRCLPDHASRAFPVFLSYRPGARDIARVAAVIEAAEVVLPALLRA